MAVFLNGAAIAWKSKRHTSVGLNTTEAEVKAVAPGVEVVRSLTGLWGEFMRQRHGSARVLDDYSAAIAQVKRGMDVVQTGSVLRRRGSRPANSVASSHS